MTKVHGPENPADLMTKFLDAETMYKHVKKLGLKVRKEHGRMRVSPIERVTREEERADSTL
eukprot:550408-Amphidinium_carterae.1